MNDPKPDLILDLLQAFRRSKTMFAAVSLGVFDALTEPMSRDALAAKLQLDADALQRLLDACVGLQLLQFKSGVYQNTPVADTYLTQSSPRRLTGYLNYSNDVMWKLWANLEDAVREGTNRWKQTYGWDEPIFSSFFKTDESMREFLMGMHGFGLISSPQVVAAFDLSRFSRMVDLGGATGHLAIAACERYTAMTAIVFDLPNAIRLAEEIVGASSVANRIEIRAGDFFVDRLPHADLFALGRIVHDWTEEKIDALLQRICKRLPEGGACLIAEKVLNEDKTGPIWAQMQNLNMLSCTEGKERTAAEYKSLLKRNGFSQIKCVRTDSPLDAVLAVK